MSEQFGEAGKPATIESVIVNFIDGITWTLPGLTKDGAAAARITLTDLANALGYADKSKLKQLAERHASELAELGSSATVAVLITREGRGSVTLQEPTYNPDQAAYLALSSETEQGRACRVRILKAYKSLLAAFEQVVTAPPQVAPAVDLAPLGMASGSARTTALAPLVADDGMFRRARCRSGASDVARVRPIVDPTRGEQCWESGWLYGPLNGDRPIEKFLEVIIGQRPHTSFHFGNNFGNIGRTASNGQVQLGHTPDSSAAIEFTRKVCVAELSGGLRPVVGIPAVEVLRQAARVYGSQQAAARAIGVSQSLVARALAPLGVSYRKELSMRVRRAVHAILEFECTAAEAGAASCASAPFTTQFTTRNPCVYTSSGGRIIGEFRRCPAGRAMSSCCAPNGGARR